MTGFRWLWAKVALALEVLNEKDINKIGSTGMNGLTLMLLLANLANTKIKQKSWKMTETLVYGYSSKSTQRELSNEHQHDRVQMIIKNLCILGLWVKVALALEGLSWIRFRHGIICTSSYCHLLLHDSSLATAILMGHFMGKGNSSMAIFITFLHV